MKTLFVCSNELTNLVSKVSTAYLTTQQLYPALDSLWRLGFLNMLQGLIQQHISRWSIRLADNLGKQKKLLYAFL